MGESLEGHWWGKVALITLFFMLGGFALHPFIPHEHEHSFFDTGPLSVVHVGVAQRADMPTTAFSLLEFSLMLPVFLSTIAHAMLRGVQHVDIPIRLSLADGLKRGILHSKAY